MSKTTRIDTEVSMAWIVNHPDFYVKAMETFYKNANELGLIKFTFDMSRPGFIMYIAEQP